MVGAPALGSGLPAEIPDPHALEPEAADSVLDEVNDNTWDFQKLSALSPWSLAFGKLFGSTIYCWYGGLIAFAVAVGISLQVSPPYKVFVGGALILLGGVIVQATAARTAERQRAFTALLRAKGRDALARIAR